MDNFSLDLTLRTIFNPLLAHVDYMGVSNYLIIFFQELYFSITSLYISFEESENV